MVGDTAYSETDCYVRALEINPGYSTAWRNLSTQNGGTVSGQLYSKVECLVNCLEQDPANYGAWNSLGTDLAHSVATGWLYLADCPTRLLCYAPGSLACYAPGSLACYWQESKEVDEFPTSNTERKNVTSECLKSSRRTGMPGKIWGQRMAVRYQDSYIWLTLAFQDRGITVGWKVVCRLVRLSTLKRSAT